VDHLVPAENVVEEHHSVAEFTGLGDGCVSLAGSAGVQESTLRTWLIRSGAQGRKLHEHFFRNLSLGHIQLDELWANIKEKGQAL
jgi:hypothetical protein